MIALKIDQSPVILALLDEFDDVAVFILQFARFHIKQVEKVAHDDDFFGGSAEN